MNPYSFSILFFCFSTFFVGFFTWLRRLDIVGLTFFLFNVFCAGMGWSCAITIDGQINSEQGLFWSRMLNVCTLFIATSWYHFTVAFAKVENRKRWVINLYLGALVLLCTAPTELFIKDVHQISIFKYCAIPGPIYNLHTVYFFTVVIMGFMNLAGRLKVAETSRDRKQIIGFLIATATGFLGGAVCFLPVYGFSFPQYNLFFMPIYPFLLAYLMSREYLFDAEKFAELAHQEKIETIAALASSVNHEIRNPLYIVKSQAETLIDKGSEDPFAKKALEQTTRAMDIMRRFSSFAKQESSKIKQERINVKQTLSDVLQLLSYELEIDKIEIKDNLPEDLVVNFDRRHLEQIFFNLIRNACQEVGQDGEIEISSSLRTSNKGVKSFDSAQDDGEPVEPQSQKIREITLPDKVDARDDTKIQITISDNGPGIPKERLNQIFEPFYSTKEEGSGVGLYVTRQLVERNGGKISVESTPGKGTNFKLTFLKTRDPRPETRG